MDITLTDSLGKCFNEEDIFCIILTPLAIAASVIPSSTVIYILCKKNEGTNIIYSAIGFLYGLIALQSIVIMDLASSDDSTDYVLFCIGIANASLFTVAFVMDFLKKYPSLTNRWKMARLIFGLGACIFVILINTANFGDGSYYLVLVFILGDVAFMCVIVLIAGIKLTRSAIPVHFFISNTLTYGLWNMLAWKLVTSNKGFTVSSTFGLAVLIFAFLFQITFCISYFVAARNPAEELGGSLFYDLERGFAQNIKSNTTFND